MSIFSDRLKQLRIDNGYNQEQFAALLGLSRRTYQYYETGEKFPKADVLMEIASKLDVSSGYLLGEEDKETQPPLLNARLKTLRTEKNLTQAEISSIIKRTASAYSNYEKGIHVPPLDTLIALADYFGVSLDYLVGRTDEK